MQTDIIAYKQHMQSEDASVTLNEDFEYFMLRAKVSEDEMDAFIACDTGRYVTGETDLTVTAEGAEFFNLLPLSAFNFVSNRPKIAIKFYNNEIFNYVIDYGNYVGLYNTKNYDIVGIGNSFTISFDSYVKVGELEVKVGEGSFTRGSGTQDYGPFKYYLLSNGANSDQNSGRLLIPFVIVSETRVLACQWYVAYNINRYYGLNLNYKALSNEVAIVNAFNSVEPVIPSTDPFEPGGESGTGGGTGTFTDNGDPIDFPGLPSLSAVDTGFITLFNPSLSQLRNLANYMWSNLFDLNGWKKIFADPMDAILGLSIVPVAVPDGGTRAVTVGNISTGVNMTIALSQYVEVDCGTLNVEEYWGAYLDYDPYTKCSIYLPYIGTHAISVDDVMGKPVHIKYHIDILSGACTAFIKCGQSVMYEFIGQCSSSIPITGDNWTNVINGVLSIAGSVGTMIATGGLSSAAMGAGAAAAIAPIEGLGITPNATPNRIASMAQDVMAMKPQVEKSGAMSGTGGMLAVQTPYMILERPRQAVPRYQNDFLGYPSFIFSRIGDLSGYTEMESVHLEAIPCYGNERAEIQQFLEGGVIL